SELHVTLRRTPLALWSTVVYHRCVVQLTAREWLGADDGRSSERELAQVIRDLTRGQPGHRSAAAIVQLRRQRKARRSIDPLALPWISRAGMQHLTDCYLEEIERRGGETTIRSDKDRFTPLRLLDRADGFVLLGLDAWRYYSG